MNKEHFDECLNCDAIYTVTKKDTGYCEPCFAKWQERDKKSHILCRMYNRYSWWTFWWWIGIGSIFIKLHNKYCPDIKEGDN